MPRSRQANNKTQAHDGSVDAFIATVEPAGRKEDAYESGTGSSCLYRSGLQNVDVKVLRRLADKSVKDMRSKYAQHE